MREALVSASIAAIVAAIVSLPLRSPDDALFNSATVATAVLVVGIAAVLDSSVALLLQNDIDFSAVYFR